MGIGHGLLLCLMGLVLVFGVFYLILLAEGHTITLDSKPTEPVEPDPLQDLNDKLK